MQHDERFHSASELLNQLLYVVCILITERPIEPNHIGDHLVNTGRIVFSVQMPPKSLVHFYVWDFEA